MPARTITAVSIGGICSLARPKGGKRIDHAHSICSDICGYVMAPRSPLQCTHRNKNVSARQKVQKGILRPPGARGRIAVLFDLTRKWPSIRVPDWGQWTGGARLLS